jgi:hypothetical protein
VKWKKSKNARATASVGAHSSDKRRIEQVRLRDDGTSKKRLCYPVLFTVRMFAVTSLQPCPVLHAAEYMALRDSLNPTANTGQDQ